MVQTSVPGSSPGQRPALPGPTLNIPNPRQRALHACAQSSFRSHRVQVQIDSLPDSCGVAKIQLKWHRTGNSCVLHLSLKWLGPLVVFEIIGWDGCEGLGWGITGWRRGGQKGQSG